MQVPDPDCKNILQYFANKSKTKMKKKGLGTQGAKQIKSQVPKVVLPELGARPPYITKKNGTK